MKLDQEQLAELQALENEGVLKAEKVVEFAADPDTALHRAFPRSAWDDEAAAHQYRLMIARRIIVSVEVRANPDAARSVAVQAYVSLRTDRSQEGGGYRKTVDVMSDEDMRAQLFEQALKDLEYWQRKYAGFEEFAAIYDEIVQARTRGRRPRRPRPRPPEGEDE